MHTYAYMHAVCIRDYYWITQQIFHYSIFFLSLALRFFIGLLLHGSVPVYVCVCVCVIVLWSYLYFEGSEIKCYLSLFGAEQFCAWMAKNNYILDRVL